jgi:hypothetical protein
MAKQKSRYGKNITIDGTLYKSLFEGDICKNLKSKNVSFSYEEDKFDYKVEEIKKYNPDFKLPNGIYVEAKGLFTAANRKKHLLVKKQHPELDIRFLFQRANNKLSKKSKTTYAAWCDKNGFIWAEGTKVPQNWINE